MNLRRTYGKIHLKYLSVEYSYDDQYIMKEAVNLSSINPESEFLYMQRGSNENIIDLS